MRQSTSNEPAPIPKGDESGFGKISKKHFSPVLRTAGGTSSKPITTGERSEISSVVRTVLLKR